MQDKLKKLYRLLNYKYKAIKDNIAINMLPYETQLLVRNDKKKSMMKKKDGTKYSKDVKILDPKK